MLRKPASVLLGFGLSVFVSAQFPGADSPDAKVRKGYDAITISDAKKILSFLAGPECEGRGTGQPGFQKAADFVAKQFKSAGLKPLGDNGTYFQNVPFYRNAVEIKSLTDDEGKSLSTDGFALQSIGDVDLKGEVVLIRTSDPKATLSDEALAAVKGKIVILDPPKEKNSLRSQLFTSDATAIFTLTDEKPTSSTRVAQRKTSTGPVFGAVTGSISRAVAASYSRSLKTALDAEKSSIPVITETKFSLNLVAKGVSEEVPVPNVVGMLEGSHPKLKNEIIGIGGHLDHLGKTGDVIYYGADDDGSGSTAVLEIVKAFKANKVKPRRSIIFMTFYGEEMGLLGSAHLANNPPVPLDQWVAELQMDMVGRDSYGVQNGDRNRVDVEAENKDTIRLVGSKRISTELDQIINQVNRYVGFKFKYDAEDVYTRSDHYNFASKGIPIAFLFDGFTPDYHQPSDTVDKINFLKLTNAAKLYYLTAFEIADREEPIKRDVQSGK